MPTVDKLSDYAGDFSRSNFVFRHRRATAAIQLNGISTDHELYRYVMHTFRSFEQVLFSKMLDDEASRGAESAAERKEDEPLHDVVPQAQEMSDAIVSLWFEDNLVRFTPLEQLADR